MENQFLTVTSAEMMVLNQNLAPKELIVLNILKYKHRVNKSRDMSRGYFSKNRKLLTNWWPL